MTNPGCDAVLDQVEAALDDPVTAGEYILPVKPPAHEMRQRVGARLYEQLREIMKNKNQLTPPQIERTRKLTTRMLVELFDMSEKDIDVKKGWQDG